MSAKFKLNPGDTKAECNRGRAAVGEIEGVCPEWADAEFWIRDTEDENDLGMDLDEFCAKNALGEHQARG
ncbi:MAG: hypothetical protein VZQ28_01375 [Methanomethylophilus sp.]|nr:hypothetical protein [Methanomethylophilus sp.]